VLCTTSLYKAVFSRFLWFEDRKGECSVSKGKVHEPVSYFPESSCLWHFKITNDAPGPQAQREETGWFDDVDTFSGNGWRKYEHASHFERRE
jgi:hypothetical protein